MAPNLETYYLALLGNPEEGNIPELEKKFKRASAEYLVTREADRVDISLIQRSGELTSAYLYLKAKWELKAKQEPFIPRILRMEPVKAIPLTKLEKLHAELLKLATAGLLIAGIVGIFQFGQYALNNSFRTNSKSLDQLIIEEQQLQAYGNKKAIEKKIENSKDFATKLEAKELSSIHIAAKSCDINQLSGLINRGTNINKTDKDGETPLHWTSRINCVKGSALLIRAGARTDIKDQAGNTALDWAKVSNNFESIRLLQKTAK